MGSQQNKIRLALAGIFLTAVFAVVIDFPQYLEKSGLDLPDFLNLHYRLGLDLQGGTQLIYEADVSKIPAADQADRVEGAKDTIERRSNPLGVAEPIIQVTKVQDKWRIIAELAGIFDVNQAIKKIGETPLLEFKEQDPNPQVNLTEDQQKELDEYNLEAKKKADDVLIKVLVPGADFTKLATENSEDTSTKNASGDLGFAKRGQFAPQLGSEFEKVCFDDLKVGETAKQLVQSSFGYHIIKKDEEKGSGDDLEARCRHIFISTKSQENYITEANKWLYTGLTGQQLEKAQVIFEPNTNVPQISIEFDEEGKNLFAAITRRSVGKPVAIFLDGSEISVPTVQEPILDGKAVISGKFTIQEAKLLVKRLNEGAIPVPINLISQKTVGASLGNESINQSLKAGFLSLILICLFMILYYRLPGLIACVALIFYAVVVLAIFKIINVTLTLAGIAGFILSLGMAVDANVLIFERFKEEIRWGKPFTVALEEGFRRAWSSIFDGHVSTLIACAILMGFTTSLVKGFAIVLSIGTLMSLFSAVWVTRIIVLATTRVSVLNKNWLYGAKKKTTE